MVKTLKPSIQSSRPATSPAGTTVVQRRLRASSEHDALRTAARWRSVSFHRSPTSFKAETGAYWCPSNQERSDTALRSAGRLDAPKHATSRVRTAMTPRFRASIDVESLITGH